MSGNGTAVAATSFPGERQERAVRSKAYAGIANLVSTKETVGISDALITYGIFRTFDRYNGSFQTD